MKTEQKNTEPQAQAQNFRQNILLGIDNQKFVVYIYCYWLRRQRVIKKNKIWVSCLKSPATHITNGVLALMSPGSTEIMSQTAYLSSADLPLMFILILNTLLKSWWYLAEFKYLVSVCLPFYQYICGVLTACWCLEDISIVVFMSCCHGCSSVLRWENCKCFMDDGK